MINSRFESKFSKTEGCWIWNAATDSRGYGAFRYNGKRTTASRVSYLLYKGEITDDLHVLHTCDNPSCVNPQHLFLGTNKDNVEDRIAKGRRAGRLKVLTPQDFLLIKEFIKTNSYRATSRITGFSRETIRRVAIGTYNFN